MKGSVSFYLNNAIFTQSIREGSGHVKCYIRQKIVQNWLKNQCFKKRSVYFKIWAWLALVEIVQDFSVEFTGNSTKIGFTLLI